LCNPMMKMMMIIIFCPFPSNEAPVEWSKYSGKKPVPVPLRPLLTRDRTRASAVGGRRLTAWAMAQP
jgi:hypothetical protein